MSLTAIRSTGLRNIQFDRRRWGFTATTMRVLALKLSGVLLLIIAVLYVGEVRQKLVESTVDSLIVQAEALRATLDAIGPSATISLAAVEEANADPDAVPSPVTTVIDRNQVERLFAAMLSGTDTSATLYGVDGSEITGSTIALSRSTDVIAQPLTALVTETVEETDGGVGAFLRRRWARLVHRIDAASLSGPDGQEAPSALIRAALSGVRDVQRYLTPDGDMRVRLAVPITDPDGTVVAALELESGARLVNALARDYDRSIAQLLLLSLALTTVVCFVLSATISNPIVRLSRAADAVTRGQPYRSPPNIRNNSLLGNLDRTLSDMTDALTNRIDAIEAFAAEVAHELKNPLSSLRSAVETFPLAKNDASRAKLLEIIDHDVKRIDRLITGIAETSKLDAELSRSRRGHFDLVGLLRTCVSAQSELAAERDQTVSLSVRGTVHPGAFQIAGNDVKIGQVVTNLLDNACSFTPPGGTVKVTLQRFADFVEIIVDDEGPGVKEEVLERIFERFYTDRAEGAFGNNSGLGLAICRQIVDAHNGEIFAENRYRTTIGEREVLGARFTVRLPA